MNEQEIVLAKELLITGSKIDESGCWIWQRGRHYENGYGAVTIAGVQWRTHRLSWQAFRGAPGAFSVLHKCDVRPCVNPDHLFLGTQADNRKDCIDKGRSANGEKNGMAKLTVPEVLAIRAAAASGTRQKALAEKHGVNQQTISKIVTKRRWGHI